MKLLFTYDEYTIYKIYLKFKYILSCSFIVGRLLRSYETSQRLNSHGRKITIELQVRIARLRRNIVLAYLSIRVNLQRYRQKTRRIEELQNQ